MVFKQLKKKAKFNKHKHKFKMSETQTNKLRHIIKLIVMIAHSF